MCDIERGAVSACPEAPTEWVQVATRVGLVCAQDEYEDEAAGPGGRGLHSRTSNL